MYERPWQRRRRSDGSEPAGLVIMIVLIGGLIAGAMVSARIAAPSVDVQTLMSGSRAPERVQSGHPAAANPAPQVEAQPTVAPTAAPTVAPTAAPTPAEAGRARVANTDGQGVVLRASPSDRDWTPRGFMDGTNVTVLRRQGADWVFVRGDNGQEGWVPARYLAVQ